MTTNIEPDDDLLEAALAFLDAYDDAGDVFTLGLAQTLGDSVRQPTRPKPRAVVGETSPLQVEIRYSHAPLPPPLPAIKTANVVATGPKRPNYKKREIERLKDQVRQLEAIVEERKRAGKAWQDIARRQLHQRKRSEADHAELLVAIEEQSEFISELRRLMARYHRRAETWSRLGVAFPPSTSNAWNADVLSASFEDLTTALDAMQLQADTALSDSRLDTHDSSVHVSTQRARNELVIQALNAKTLPFRHGDVVDAVWHHLLLRSAGSRFEQIEELPNNTYATQCLAQTQVGPFRSRAHIKTVLRRFELNDVVRIIRAATFLHTDDEQSNTKSLHRMPVRHFLWAGVSRLRNADGSVDENSSQIKCCCVSVPPVHPDTVEADTSDFLARCMEIYAVKMNEDTENYLVAKKTERELRAAT